MIIAYINPKKPQPEIIQDSNVSLLAHAIWIDLLSPTKEEERLVEKNLHMSVPTREEMQEIEPSSRLYKENKTIYMTATMIANSNGPFPISDAITLILKDDKLITVRYIEPQAFASFTTKLPRLSIENHRGNFLIIELLESAIDRLADITEHVGRALDHYSQVIFRKQSLEKIKLDYKFLLQDLGSKGDLNTKVWESLASFNRLSGFFEQVVTLSIDEELKTRSHTLTKDIAALSDQVKFLTTKVNFLLDATLGMVNIEQNNIIKIFSIAAVIFLPPTLIASIYGMNFNRIPELQWRFGYPFALGLMVVSGWLPYMYFKLKKWL